MNPLLPLTEKLRTKWAVLGAKLRGSLRSVTMWFNSLFAPFVPFIDYLQYQIPAIQPYVPEHLYGYSFVTIALVNMYLRFFKTTMAVEDKAPATLP